jgi:hypothetical protein
MKDWAFEESMRNAKRTLGLAMATAIASAIPSAGWACSGCMAGDPKTAHIYLGMTLMMSALPLIMIGALCYWLWQRYS